MIFGNLKSNDWALNVYLEMEWVKTKDGDHILTLDWSVKREQNSQPPRAINKMTL